MGPQVLPGSASLGHHVTVHPPTPASCCPHCLQEGCRLRRAVTLPFLAQIKQEAPHLKPAWADPRHCPPRVTVSLTLLSPCQTFQTETFFSLLFFIYFSLFLLSRKVPQGYIPVLLFKIYYLRYHSLTFLNGPIVL